MKFRVIGFNSGKKIKPQNREQFLLNQDGKVVVITDCDQSCPEFLDVRGGYIVEFAFQRRDNGKWFWTEGVVVV